VQSFLLLSGRGARGVGYNYYYYTLNLTINVKFPIPVPHPVAMCSKLFRDSRASSGIARGVVHVHVGEFTCNHFHLIVVLISFCGQRERVHKPREI
jgi:hypothetical protein